MKTKWGDLTIKHQYLSRIMFTPLLEGEILGHLPSGKNNYEIKKSWKSGKLTLVKHGLRQYEKDFAKQALVLAVRNKLKAPISGALALVAKVWFHSFRRDVDTILFCDLLQKSGLIKNDRMIRLKVIDGVHMDAKNPRVEFCLYGMEEEA